MQNQTAETMPKNTPSQAQIRVRNLKPLAVCFVVADLQGKQHGEFEDMQKASALVKVLCLLLFWMLHRK